MTIPHEAPKKRQLPTVYTLLFIIIALMAALTWVLPAGKYNYVTAKTQQPIAAAAVADYSGDERLLPVPGSYTELPSQPQGVFDVLKAPIQGFHKAADVALFVLIIGGFLAVTMQSRLEHYLVALVCATRPGSGLCPALEPLIAVGASPRATLGLARSARARAWLAGRDYVLPEDIQLQAYPVLRHRLIPSYQALADNLDNDILIAQLLDQVPCP